jgi:iron(III) transport system ATP-binding protein
LKDVTLQVNAGETLALLGPSGSGKTSLLRVVMGLATPQQGTLSLEGRVLAEAARTIVPAEDRPFAYLFQDFTLFPHLSVRENITIGMRHLASSEQAQRLDELAELLQVKPLLSRYIHGLSGGEQQRVALARTLAVKPRLLLLDEPFSNLDKMTKVALYHEVKDILRGQGIAAILATHDQSEAFYFSDRIGVMSGGQLMALSAPRDLYENPGSTWLAHFTGESHILEPSQIARFFNNGSEFELTSPLLLVRPEDIVLEEGGDWTIRDVEYYGFFHRIVLTHPDRPNVTAVKLGQPDFAVGQQVRLTLSKRPIDLKS